MRVTPRQVFRLLKVYRADGPSALLSKRRGKPSNRSYVSIVRTEALALIKANYADFSLTKVSPGTHKGTGRERIACRKTLA